MQNIDKKIIEFIKKHHVLTLATCCDNQPYCANCFYTYVEDENLFVFTSDKTTKHIQDVEKQNKVAASIVLETSTIGKIQGLQITGVLTMPEGELMSKINREYLKQYPFAVVMKTTLWALQPNFMKLTDNRLGFGKKLIWEE